MWKNIATNLTIDGIGHPDYYQVPQVVMSTAVTKFNINDPMFITWTPGGGNAVIQYICMHFAELENLQPNQSRQCNIFLNGNLWKGSFVPRYLSTSTVQSSPDGEIGQQFQIWINQTETSTLPPILNAVEFYTLRQFLQAQTDQEDGMFLPHKNSAPHVLFAYDHYFIICFFNFFHISHFTPME